LVVGYQGRLPEVSGVRLFYPKRLKALLGKNWQSSKATNLQSETRQAAIGVRLFYPKRLKALLGKNWQPSKATNLQSETRQAAIWNLEPGTHRRGLGSGAFGIRRVDTLSGAIVELAAKRQGSERTAE